MSRITSKGQVTIPKEIRDRFGLRPGTDVAFSVENGQILLHKAETEDVIERWIGILDLPRGVDAFIDDIRGDG